MSIHQNSVYCQINDSQSNIEKFVGIDLDEYSVLPPMDITPAELLKKPHRIGDPGIIAWVDDEAQAIHACLGNELVEWLTTGYGSTLPLTYSLYSLRKMSLHSMADFHADLSALSQERDDYWSRSELRDFQKMQSYWSAIKERTERSPSPPVFDDDILLREFPNLFDAMLWLMNSEETKTKSVVLDRERHWIPIWIALFRRAYNRDALIMLAAEHIRTEGCFSVGGIRMLDLLGDEIHSDAMRDAREVMVSEIEGFHGSGDDEFYGLFFDAWQILAFPRSHRRTAADLLDSEALRIALWRFIKLLRSRDGEKELNIGRAGALAQSAANMELGINLISSSTKGSYISRRVFASIIIGSDQPSTNIGDRICLAREAIARIESQIAGGGTKLFRSDGDVVVRHYRSLAHILLPTIDLGSGDSGE